MSLTLDEMRLSPNARYAAQLVLARHPSVVFTSGRRDVREQAKAMAANTLRYGVAWLGQTYKNRQMVEELESWMEQNLEKTASLSMLAEGFYLTLQSTQAGQLSQFPHCRGDAFDIQCPRYADGRINEGETSAIRTVIETLPQECGLQLILTREGQHRVIHAQFNHVVEPVQV